MTCPRVRLEHGTAQGNHPDKRRARTRARATSPNLSRRAPCTSLKISPAASLGGRDGSAMATHRWPA